MAFDVINGVAHFKIFFSMSSGGVDTFRNNIISNLAKYLPQWTKNDENTQLKPSWTSSGRVEFLTTSYFSGIYILLFSQGINGYNSNYFKDSNKNYDYDTRIAASATPFNWMVEGNSWTYCYLNVVKSKTGRSFAFSLSHDPSNQMQCLIAEDESGNIALFQIMGGKQGSGSYPCGTRFSSYLYLARDEKSLAKCGDSYYESASASPSMQGSFLCLDPIIKPNIKTSLVKTPNLLGNNLFKEIYNITSTSIPLNELDDAVFIVDGHKYKPISGYSLARSGSFCGASAGKCAGPFALEIE